MVSKHVFILLLIVSLLAIPGVNAATDKEIEMANAQGKIVCKDASGNEWNASPNVIYSTRECIVIAKSDGEKQSIKLSQKWDAKNIPEQDAFIFRKLDLSQSNAALQFYNDNSKVDSKIEAACKVSSILADGQAPGRPCSIPGVNFARGGRGGPGGDDGGKNGGAGGAGGAGGNNFYLGTIGGGGSNAGSDDNEPLDRITSASVLAGANVKIQSEEIIFPSQNNGHIISVDGHDGSIGKSYEGTDDKSGDGGSGGSGGSGAGALDLIARKIIGNISISAIGGNGGDGGDGEDAKKADGGSGGGGGAGAGGNIYIYTTQEQMNTHQLTANINTSGGIRGEVDIAAGRISGCDGSKGYCYGEDGDSAEAGSVDWIYSEVGPNYDYTQCLNGEDNDYDGLVDFEDPDCWTPKEGETIEDIEQDIIKDNSNDINSLDMQGPISLSLVNTSKEPNWFNGTAKGGADGVCGDDPIIPFGVNIPADCHTTINSSSQSFPTEIILYCNDNRGAISLLSEVVVNGICEDARTYSDYTELDVVFHGQDPRTSCAVNQQYPVSFPGNCEIANEEMSNGNYYLELYCSGDPIGNTGQITPTGSCTSNEYSISPGNSGTQLTVSFNEQNLEEQCSSLGDSGYVDADNKRYFCSQDLGSKFGNDAIDFVKSDGNPTEWKWWNARGTDTMFKTHYLNGTDYIANGQQWFMCNATGTATGNAISVGEKETFNSTIGGQGGLTCGNVLQIIGPEIWDGNICSSSGSISVSPLWTTNDEFLYVNNSDTPGGFEGFYCEKDSDGIIPSYQPGPATSFSSSECATDCYYIVEGDSSGTRVENFIPPQAVGAQCEATFNTTFCDFDPFNPDCQGNNVFNSQGGTSKLFEQSDCGFDLNGCLDGPDPIDKSKKCNDINPYSRNGEQYEGYLCNQPNSYCTTGNYLDTSDHKPENNQYCCEVPQGVSGIDACQPIGANMDATVCSAIDGNYLDMTTYSAGDWSCQEPGFEVKGDDGMCCVGGKWNEHFQKQMYNALSEPGVFTCYEQNNKNRFAECCGDLGICSNAQDLALFDDREFLFGYYGQGGILHTVKNFDIYRSGSAPDSPNTVLDLVNQISFNSESEITIRLPDSDSSQGDLQLTDWSNFEELHFDLAFNLPDKIDNISIINTDNKKCTFTGINKYLLTGNSTFRWQHVVLPLTDGSTATANTCHSFDYSNIDKIEFGSGYPSQSRDNLMIVVDDFFLSEEPLQTVGNQGVQLAQTQNTENLYCTGNFASWIDNLDGPDDTGFMNKKSTTIDDYGPHKYACEAQNSFEWTGNACCGDDTTRHYTFDDFNLGTVKGEYYSDSQSGCYGGNVVYNNMRLGTDALNDPEHDGLLFFNGEFKACAASKFRYASHGISMDGETVNSEKLVSENVSAFETRGKYLCDASGRWLTLDEVPVSRIIASKMYNLTFDNGQPHDQYEIQCDKINQYYEGDIPYTDNQNIVDNNIKDFCTLQYRNNNEDFDNTLIGLSLQDTSVQNFLTSVTREAQVLGHLDTTQNLTGACNGIFGGRTTNTEFFQTCTNYTLKGGAGGLRIAYNPDFNIVFIAIVEDEIKDYYGMFNTQRFSAFLHSHFLRFIDFFGNIFGGNNAAGYDSTINWSNETLLPFLDSDEVSFTTVYMAKNNGKTVKAFVYNDLDRLVQSNNLEYITVEWTGFATDVRPIVSDYFSDHALALNYLKGPDKQIVQMVNPLQQGYNTDHTLVSGPRKKTFAPKFHWKRLAPMLEIDGADYGTAITAQPRDGMVDFGEYCDDKGPGTPVQFRFDTNKCQFWNATHLNGTVTCNVATNTLDHSKCTIKNSISGPVGVLKVN